MAEGGALKCEDTVQVCSSEQTRTSDGDTRHTLPAVEAEARCMPRNGPSDPVHVNK